MGLNYIWDTNIVIYYFNKQFPLIGEKFIDDLLLTKKPAISVITEIELLCWPSASLNDLKIFGEFIVGAIVYKLDDAIKQETIKIKKHFKLKLPDAIIAATAVVKDLTLISNDRKGFPLVTSLKLLNPFEKN